MNQIHGCQILRFNERECREILKWINGGERPANLANIADDVRWVLAHCTDGVTWGRYRGDSWQMSYRVFPDLTPEVTEENLIELRVFGKESEILIWRNEGTMAGRVLRDNHYIKKEEDVLLKPAEEVRILLGDRLLDGPRNSFSRVGTATGQEQTVPLECYHEDFQGGRWPLRLKLRHYFEKDEKTGMVRVAVSRLVEIYKENDHGA